MSRILLSLDISAASTGYAVKFQNKLEFGLIKTTNKSTEGERLVLFRNELINILSKYRPTHIVMEDIFGGRNMKTLKLLAKFSGVAQECNKAFTGIDTEIMHTSTVRAYFKVKTKREIFDEVISLLGWEDKEWSFNKYNDITDAISQLICYENRLN